METGLKLSDGLVYVENAETTDRTVFSSKFACPVSGFTIEEIEPRLFSFNNPYGACPHCDGIGAKLYMDPDLIVPNPNLSLNQGAIAPWNVGKSAFYHQTLVSLCDFLNISPTTPWKDLPENAKNLILFGSGDVCVPMYYSRFVSDKPFEGVVPNMERRFLETDSAWIREGIFQIPVGGALRILSWQTPEAGSAGRQGQRFGYYGSFRNVYQKSPRLV